MKKIILFLPFISSCIFCHNALSQDTSIIRLKNDLTVARSDTDRINILLSLCNKYPQNSDSAFYFANSAVILSRKINKPVFEAYSLMSLSKVLHKKNDLTNSLETLLQSLGLYEKLGDTRHIAFCEESIAIIYTNMEDWQASLNYVWKAYYNYKKINSISDMVSMEVQIGYSYLGLNKLDSALFFENKAYEKIISDTALKNSILFFYVNSDLGETHIKLKNYSLALAYIMAEINLPGIDHSWDYYDIATIYKETGQTDSAIYYCKKSLNGAQKVSYQKLIILTTSLLNQLYKPLNRDSAYTYLSLNQLTNDSLFSQENLRKAQSITFQHQLHEQEEEAKKIKDEEKRVHNLQYAAIALGLISFIILFLLFSHSIIANQKLIRFLGVIALLIVFEFINLYIHPYLSSITKDSPLIMLLIMVCIAALLVPVHHRMEKWISHRLVEKNKKIRLAAARKTIADLEGK